MKNCIKRIIALGTLILVSTSCSFGPPIEIGPKPKAPTYIPTEQGVDKMPSKYIYKDLIEYNDYNLSCAPSIGEAKLLVIPVWFTDSSKYIDVSKKESVRQDISDAYFGDDTGWESVVSYYKKDSFNRLTISGLVTDWYEINRASSFYYTDNDGRTTNLVISSINWVIKNHPEIKLTDYDADHDGYLDGVMLIYGAPDCASLNLPSGKDNLWAYTYWVQDASARNKDRPITNAYFWASYDFMYEQGIHALAHTGKSEYGMGQMDGGVEIDAHTFIHEMGHVFGLDDYYDYGWHSYTYAGAFSMQDHNMGAHDPFSRIALGWVDPYVPTSTCTFTVKPIEESGEVVVLSPDYYGSPFDEYIILELYTPTGLNEHDVVYQYGQYQQGPDQVGVRLWHIDARLYNTVTKTVDREIYSGNGDKYVLANNNTSSGDRAKDYAGSTKFNLNHLVRKDKFVQYNNSFPVSNGDLFVTGDEFSVHEYYKQFANLELLNSGLLLRWKVNFDSVTSEGMTITCTRT